MATKKKLILASILLISSWTVVFLSVIKVISPNLLLYFISYGVAIVGFFLGFSGTLELLIARKQKKGYNPFEEDRDDEK